MLRKNEEEKLKWKVWSESKYINDHRKNESFNSFIKSQHVLETIEYLK